MFRPNRYRRFRPDERALLDALLDVGAPGFDALRAQLDLASYKAAWFPGSMSFDIHTGGGPRFSHEDSDPDGRGSIVQAREVYRGGSPKSDDNVIGTVFLWVANGYLSALEYQSTGERLPHSLPAPVQLGD